MTRPERRRKGARPQPDPTGLPEPIGSSLDRVMRELGTAPARVLSRIFTQWDELVGPEIAAHCRPASLHGDVLTLESEEPGWVDRGPYVGPRIVSLLAAALGDGAPTAVHFVIRRSPG